MLAQSQVQDEKHLGVQPKQMHNFELRFGHSNPESKYNQSLLLQNMGNNLQKRVESIPL